jgi:hypothetical protein
MKEPLLPGIWKFSESKNRQFQVFKISESNCSLETRNLIWFFIPKLCYNQIFDFSIIAIIYQNQVFDFFDMCDNQLWYPDWYPTGVWCKF